MTTDFADVTQTDVAATQVTEDSAPSADELTEARSALGLESTDAEPAPAGTEPDAQDDDVKALLEANSKRVTEEASAKAREDTLRETEEQRRLTDSRNQFEGIKRSYAQRTNAIRQLGAQQGWDQQATEVVVNAFNAHHAQASSVRDGLWWDSIIDYARERVPDAAQSIVSDYEAGKFDNPYALFDRITEAKATASSKGMFTKSQLEEEKALAYVRGKRAAQKPGTSTTGLPQSRTSRASSSRSDDELLADPETPIETIMEIRARQRA